MNRPPDTSIAGSNQEWRPTATLEVLRQRSKLLQQLRSHFLARGYWEVETPLMSRDVCIDASIDPFLVAGTRFLQTSPEFAMKRLLCAGADAIFEVTRSFRAGESGRLHNPEFTIVEWYRAGSTMRDQMAFVQSLVLNLASLMPRFREGDSHSFRRPLKFEAISYDDAFQQFAGISGLNASDNELRSRAKQLGIAIPDSLPVGNRDGWLNLLLSEVVEPGLASLGGVFLYDYPASQSAIARICPDNPMVAERFELYLDGIEICNGYQELTDAEELLSRMEARNQQRMAEGKPALPVNGRLSAAMREGGLPECSGVALGFDRLVMWLLGKTAISDVMSFSFDRA